MAERGKPGHVGGVEWVSAGGEMFKGGLGVDRLPEDDDVDHDAEAVELVFLPDLVVLAELAALPVEGGSQDKPERGNALVGRVLAE